MKREAIEPNNFCAHALQFVRLWEDGLKDTAPLTAQALHGLAKMLEVCDKYVLPNCCELIAPDSYEQLHLDLARLPSPCVAFEADWRRADDGIKELAGFEQQQSSKRIAFCWDTRLNYEFLPGMNSQFNGMYPTGGTFILPIFYNDSDGSWNVGMGGSFVPFRNTLRSVQETDNTPDVTVITSMAVIEAGLANPAAKHYSSEPFIFLPELFYYLLKELNGDKERALANIFLDSRDEDIMFVNACSALQCANVEVVDVPFSDAHNKKRMENSEQPFFRYKAMRLKDDTDPGLVHLRPGRITNNGRLLWV